MMAKSESKSGLTEMAFNQGLPSRLKNKLPHSRLTPIQKKQTKTTKFGKQTKALIYATLHFCFAWTDHGCSLHAAECILYTKARLISAT